MWQIHTEKFFRNLIKSNQNQIAITISGLTCNQTDVHLVPNQSENGKYNLISGSFNKISKDFSVCMIGRVFQVRSEACEGSDLTVERGRPSAKQRILPFPSARIL